MSDPKPTATAQPLPPFNPQAIITEAAKKRAQENAEAQAKEQEAMAADTAKYSPYVGKTFISNDPTQRGFISVSIFQARLRTGPGKASPAFMVERDKPHSSWWMAADVFLKTHSEATPPEFVAKSG
jgi:hypothetical protein